MNQRRGHRHDDAARSTSGQADRRAGSPWRDLSEAEWRSRLAPGAFEVLRGEATEPRGSSPLLREHRPGAFVCAGCGLPLFRSEAKFDSGSGWPSFDAAQAGNIATRRDDRGGVARVEYHCARCLGHQGHIFHDGPTSTGLRHCNDGVALRFVPD
jgi:peptide-methionine (R)-S-oxide reductase